MMPGISDTLDSCPAYQPPWALKGWISASAQATVTYHWTRSDGTSTAPQTITVGQGANAEVTDSVLAPALSAYPFTDTLRVTSPFGVSNSVRVYYYCGWGQVWLTTNALPGATNGLPYSFTVTAAGGDGRYSWGASGLPSGLTIDSSTGVISGVPHASFAPGANTASYSVDIMLNYPAGSPPSQGGGGTFTMTVYQ
jgi:hypothetical protein